VTHGKGSKKNPSYEIHPEKDLQGEQRSQRATLSKEDVYVPSEVLSQDLAIIRKILL
jgi:hypothetical protein